MVAVLYRLGSLGQFLLERLLDGRKHALGAGLGERPSARGLVNDRLVSARGVRGEKTVVAGQVEVGPRNQRGESMKQGGRRKDDRTSAAGTEGALERVADPAVLEQGKVLLGEGLPCSVTNEPQQSLALGGSHVRMKTQILRIP
jgi:hypothetical protein